MKITPSLPSPGEGGDIGGREIFILSCTPFGHEGHLFSMPTHPESCESRAWSQEPESWKREFGIFHRGAGRIRAFNCCVGGCLQFF